MNGNIQVEPNRVKLDKQGATTFLTKVPPVDAIVRLLFTKHISIKSHTISIQLGFVVFVQQEKFAKKFGDGGVGPHLFPSFQSYPPHSTLAKQGKRRVKGCAECESLSIRVSQMRIIRIYRCRQAGERVPGQGR